MSVDTQRSHSLEELRVHLGEAIAWLSSASLHDPARSLRRDETRPPFFWEPKSTVDWACRKRQQALGYPSLAPAPNLARGRLLVFLPNQNLFDGAARVATDGFFDDFNVPPWDTWVAYIHESDKLQYLVSWIPPELVAMVDRGVDVNPEGCILWFDELKSPVADKLREEGLLT